MKMLIVFFSGNKIIILGRMIRVFTITLLLVAGQLVGQDESYESQSRIKLMDISLELADPVERFGRLHNGLKIGGKMNFLFQSKPESIFFYGLEAGYNFMGRYALSFIENGVDFTESTTSHIIYAHAIGRVYPTINIWKLEPFVQFGLGYKFPFTMTSVYDTNDSDAYSSTDFNDSSKSFSYTVGGGLALPVSDYMYINMALSYNPGVSASSYGKLEEIPDNIEFSIDAFQQVDSATTIVSYSLGVTVIF